MENQEYDEEDAGAELTLAGADSMYALNATTAAFHADIAVKQAAQLAQWVHYLSGTLGNLHNQVTELEEWKRTALDDVRKMKEDHAALKRAVLDKDGRDAASAEPSDGRQQPLGLDLTAPPALPHDTSLDTSIPTPGIYSPTSSLSFGDADVMQKGEDSVQVTPTMVDGAEYQHAEWKIGNLSVKLRGCMGRALVSPPFSALGMEDLRLMMYADAKEFGQGSRNRRQKEHYAKIITEGPLEGRLSLKIPNCPDGCTVKCYYSMGLHRLGPFTHDFSQNTVSECEDFGVDWLKEVDAARSLTLCVDLSRLSSEMQ